ncbi:MAG: branched-chain amino acid ABC transporter permease [Proteobacteria bacterium]|nr:branched-chain amino acid ABC transporter permease [Pseudomonadota bacterium]
MQIFIYGLINSISLSLVALGFTLVYSISRIPNFAHGALYVATGYFAWILMNLFHFNYFISAILSVFLSCFIGAMIYRLVLIKIRGMEISEVIATYAIGLAIIEGLRWGGLRGATYTLPVIVPGSIEIFGVIVDYQRLFAVFVGLVIFLFFYIFIKFTKTGLALKGIAQDERAAMMLGIDSDKMAIVSFILGSAIAGISALIIFPLGNIVVEAGYNVLVFSIAVSIIGGLGSWLGAVIASFIIGYAQILTEVFLSTHYQMVIALLAIIITLLIRPSGLFGKQKELEERV